MTPRTRSGNKDADYKVYYSKKVSKPQQRVFPHRKKIVRRKPSKTAREPRQMTFIPEMLRRNTVQDEESEEEQEEEEDVEEGGVEVNVEVVEQQKTPETQPKRGKKRRNDVIEDEYEDEEPARSTRKRRRKSSVAKRTNNAETDGESEQESRPRLRRQSTMTQLVDGRRPTPGSREPEFKPVKRSPRTSWGKDRRDKKDKKKDIQQRTLTQMVPGLVPLGIVSDDDMEDDLEAEEAQSQAYNEALAQHLAQRGVISPATRPQTKNATPQYRGLSVDVEEGASRHLPERRAQEEDTDEEGADEYEPTQDIQLPTQNSRRTSKRLSGNVEPHSARSAQSTTRRPTKTRFSLLSTPERRRVRVIPSSQSPSDSPLSTQSASPLKTSRRPLNERAGNPILDTPSKLKRVTFQEPAKAPIPGPPTLRRFKSTILDSEDEEENLSEDENDAAAGEDVGAQTQALIQGIDRTPPAADVGAETQAVLHQIDQACANAEEDAALHSRESSEELGDRANPRAAQYNSSPPVIEEEDVHHEENAFAVLQDIEPEREVPENKSGSQEPVHVEDVEQQSTHHEETVATAPQEVETESDVLGTRHGPKSQEPIRGVDVSMFPTQAVPAARRSASSVVQVTEGVRAATNSMTKPSQPKQEPSWNDYRGPDEDDDFPCTPMVINDSSAEEDTAPSPPHHHSFPAAPTPSSRPHDLDLDGQPIQVLNSPVLANNESQRSVASHSSKAEKQIQTEWLSHTQLFRARAPLSSSMQGIQDPFSYQSMHSIGLPTSTYRNMAPPTSTAAALFSQATTVDGTQASPHRTPKKVVTQVQASPVTTPTKAVSHYRASPRTTPRKRIPSSQPILSAHNTPRRPQNSLQFTSPERPPPLVIPSSFPSPDHARMQDWSSPVLGRNGSVGGAGPGSQLFTQMGTAGVEDFSMPPLPPIVVGSDDEGEDEEL